MKFGLFAVADHYPAELSRTTARFYGEMLERVEAARARRYGWRPPRRARCRRCRG
jgi:hypothetical protein